jgi:tetratricopeptide (TPR) repeat protein
MNILNRGHITLIASVFISSLAHAGVPEDLASVQSGWAVATYQNTGERKITALENLMTSSDAQVRQHPDAAELLIWNGIVKSSLAGAKGGLGALRLAKAAKKSLEQAMALNPQALDGSAYTSLGTLYAKVPGWPVGFGDERKAEALLLKALQINPNGIDPNYFYGEFLRDQGDTAKARVYLLRARKAAPRPGRELADQGRQSEISTALKALDGR